MTTKRITHVGYSGADLRTSAAPALRSIADDSRHLAAKLWHVSRDADGPNPDVVPLHHAKGRAA